MVILENKLLKVLNNFKVTGDVIDVEHIHAGHINVTTKVVLKSGEDPVAYILQRINTTVFNDPIGIRNNIIGVTNFLKNKGVGDRYVLDYIQAKSGKTYYKDRDNNYWRVYKYIDDSVTYNILDDLDMLKEAGSAFGEFQNLLSDYPSDQLIEIIPNFHNTIARYDQLNVAAKLDTAKRLKDVKNIVDEFMGLKERACLMTKMLQNNELPLRVTHNDTKLNNVLFDVKTKKHLAVIDLDTIMPGLTGYDFGDAIRFLSNSSLEDEKDVSKIHFCVEKYKAFAEGFLAKVHYSLTPNEIETLPLGAFTMTVECGVRFLTDYLNGDVYFHVNYDDHNLVRAINQLTLAKDMLNHFDEMKKIVTNCIEDLK